MHSYFIDNDLVSVNQSGCKENKQLFKNYRPALLLPICGEIFELFKSVMRCIHILLIMIWYQ